MYHDIRYLVQHVHDEHHAIYQGCLSTHTRVSRLVYWDEP